MANSKNTCVALLRGINVGGNTIIPMTALKTCFERLGYSNVRTYINSGNVIFESTAAASPRSLETAIEDALTVTFSFKIRVIVRSASEMEQLMAAIPKGWLTDTGQKCNVIFLHHSIDSPKLLGSLHPKPGVEELYYHPGVLFWSAKTSDLTKSNMLKLSRSPLYQAMTVRNLNTLYAIHKLMNSI
jgi:uncharacterized protein (DUF1697 family)